MSAMSARELLELRARELAEPKALVQIDLSLSQHLLFTRAGGRYALDTDYALEVIALGALTPLPHVPSHHLGLTAARGELLPLFDLTILLGDQTRPGPARWLLLCGESRPELALAIDEALELTRLTALLPAPEGASSLISGISSTGFTVIDGKQLLADRRLTIDSAQPENAP